MQAVVLHMIGIYNFDTYILVFLQNLRPRLSQHKLNFGKMFLDLRVFMVAE